MMYTFKWSDVDRDSQIVGVIAAFLVIKHPTVYDETQIAEEALQLYLSVRAKVIEHHKAKGGRE